MDNQASDGMDVAAAYELLRTKYEQMLCRFKDTVGKYKELQAANEVGS